MAVNGLFTYEDLYAGRSFDYNSPYISPPPSHVPNRHLSRLHALTTTDVLPEAQFDKLVSLPQEAQSSTRSTKLAEVIPFTYFYWLLVILAVFLTLTLTTVFICYCRTFVKNYKARRSSLPSFYRNRTSARRVHVQNRYLPNAPPPPPPPPPAVLSHPTPPCPSKSLNHLNHHMQRPDLDLGISPPVARFDLHPTERLSTFTSSSSNLPSALHSRLSVRSSDLPSKIEHSYESQRASMALADADD